MRPGNGAIDAGKAVDANGAAAETTAMSVSISASGRRVPRTPLSGRVWKKGRTGTGEGDSDLTMGSPPKDEEGEILGAKARPHQPIQPSL